MKRTILSALAISALGAVIGLAADANVNMGTWKLNEGKSKFTAGATKNGTVVYAPAGDSVKVTVDGKDGAGKAVHSDWTGKFDGKDYPVMGDATSDSRAYKVVDDHTLAMTIKKGGKVTATGTIVVSADGKSRTVTTMGTDAMGKAMNNSAVYDKQ